MPPFECQRPCLQGNRAKRWRWPRRCAANPTVSLRHEEPLIFGRRSRRDWPFRAAFVPGKSQRFFVPQNDRLGRGAAAQQSPLVETDASMPVILMRLPWPCLSFSVGSIGINVRKRGTRKFINLAIGSGRSKFAAPILWPGGRLALASPLRKGCSSRIEMDRSKEVSTSQSHAHANFSWRNQISPHRFRRIRQRAR